LEHRRPVLMQTGGVGSRLDRSRTISYSSTVGQHMNVHSEAVPASSMRVAWTRTSDFFELTKPRLTSLVLFTTWIGFYAAIQGPVPWLRLIHTLLGTALMAGGAAAFNMYAERELDALMKRTALRPLAAGRLKSNQALFFALAISIGGFIYLYVLVNPLASLLSAIVFACYLLLYTPLKTKTWMCTLAGAVPGALPIVIGWAGATGSLSFRVWVLFSIVFLWQLPHFYSIGWMYREDYARAGLPMLAVVDVSGQRTGRQTLLSIVALVLVSLMPACIGLAGGAFLAGAILLGSAFLAYGVRFARSRDTQSARHLFVVSALYLPALLILMMLEKFFSG
jgi:protoheme IX farnesyltransferase